MKPLKTFFVEPNLPGELGILKDLAYNVRWTWDAHARELFRRIDADLWEATGHNPVQMLGHLDAAACDALLADESFMYHLRTAAAEFKTYLEGEGTWYSRLHRETDGRAVAYFSAEFGIADSVPIFSGGLGVLAGDHLKSASDMGVPIIGVGLLYQHGYFQQYLNADGWQQETYPLNDFHTMPVVPVTDDAGAQVVVDVDFPKRTVRANVWKTLVGRIDLFLLDTNHPDNSASDRRITSELYGGDQERRIQQEIVLGMGGVKMLARLGIEPPVLHTNEGHAAFLTLERMRRLMKERGLSLAAAREATMGSVVFTTHTPVPAGIDVFPRKLIETYFSAFVAEVGMTIDDLIRLGRPDPEDEADQSLNMAVLAVRMSYATNTVSKLHRVTSRRMWQGLWPDVPEADVPIGSVTNGIHIPSWISNDMGALFDRYLGPRWREEPRDLELWERIDEIPMGELWRTHERRRERLVATARSRVMQQVKRQGKGGFELEAAAEILDPDVLTIGFARRFAPYKRATLLFSDMERLARILNHSERPIQILFAGKAHPRDEAGKELIQKIVTAARSPELSRRLVFLEGYDLATARYMVQGVDVWLNTPRRPKEASGTSGMKAVANGALHLSTKDGWWAEVETEGLGWTIGSGEEFSQAEYEYQDGVEAGALYDLLENEVAPLFYRRTDDGIPRGWIRLMKRSLSNLCPVFNSNRMVREYTERYYLPALAHSASLNGDDLSGAAELADWKGKMAAAWEQIELVKLESDLSERVQVGSVAKVRAWFKVAPLTPADLSIEVVHGPIGMDHRISEAGSVQLVHDSTDESGLSFFEGEVPCEAGGKFGFAIRILPRHEHLPNPYQAGLIRIIDSE